MIEEHCTLQCRCGGRDDEHISVQLCHELTVVMLMVKMEKVMVRVSGWLLGW